MRFSKQPNGRWCGYSTISDSFYHVHLTDKELVAAVIADTTRLDFACDKVPDPTSSDDLVEYCQTVCDLVEYCQTVCDRSAERINRLFHDGGYDFDQIIDHFRYDNDKRKSRAFWIRRFIYMGCDKEQMERVNARIDRLEESDDLYHPETGLKKATTYTIRRRTNGGGK